MLFTRLSRCWDYIYEQVTFFLPLGSLYSNKEHKYKTVNYTINGINTIVIRKIGNGLKIHNWEFDLVWGSEMASLRK